MATDSTHRPVQPTSFDNASFACTLWARRTALARSTRDIARRADLSQAYVVALERPRDGVAAGPIPTVDALARLAAALDMTPADLLGQALAPAGRHVVAIVPAGSTVSLELLRRGSGLTGPWVWASSNGKPSSDEVVRIDLRRDDHHPYRPSRITAALEREAAAIAHHVQGRRVGCAFVETSDVLADLDDPSALFAYEREWGDLVRDTMRRHGGRDVWNVCVYTDQALAALDDPAGAVVDLLRSHDTVWRPTPGNLLTGAPAARAALAHVRPAGVGRTTWARQVDDLVGDLALSA